MNSVLYDCFLSLGQNINKWIPVNLTDKVSDGWIKDLEFNHCLHQKPIGVLVWY